MKTKIKPRAACGREIFELIMWDCKLESRDHTQCRKEWDRDGIFKLNLVCTCKCHGKPKLCKRSPSR